MADDFRNKLDNNRELYYKDVHTLMMCFTRKGLRQVIEGLNEEIDINYVIRPFNVYDPLIKANETKNLVKFEIFFLSYYHLVKKQKFIAVEREDVK